MTIPQPPAGVCWVVATGATAERWGAELAHDGRLLPHVLVWGRARPTATREEFDRVLARERPDLVLLTSVEALSFLGEGSVDRLPAACVGPATAGAAGARGFEIAAVGDGGAAQLADNLKDLETPPRRVLWLRGREAHGEGAEVLRSAGAHVAELVTYAVEPTPGFEAEVARAPEPAAVAFGSPKAVGFLTQALERAGRRLPQGAWVLVAGNTTQQRLDALGWGAHPVMAIWSVIVGRNMAKYHPRIGDERGPRPPRDA